jgi:hypothetical protein
MNLLKFAEIYKPNREVSKFQTTGGFAIELLDDRLKLSYIQVDNVYKRLGYLARNNIVAVSECVKDTDGVVNKSLIIPNTDLKMYGCLEDTGFVINANLPNKLQEPIGIQSGKSITSVLNFNGIIIASIHLPGDGPQSVSINDFLEENLGNLPKNVNVVCGDTNITNAKTTSILPDGSNRNQEITNWFENKLGGNWIILTSGVKVGKHRRGFILRNQQLQKSVPESTKDTEADGTIMAIKLGMGITKDSVANMVEELKMLNHSSTESSENALDFKVPPEDCLQPDGSPVEKIWLDHSVLSIKMDTLCKLIGIDTDTQGYPRNLIVVNMGSIVNANHKSWNTKYLLYQSEINQADRDVYEIVRNHNPLAGLPEYANIDGKQIKDIEIVDSNVMRNEIDVRIMSLTKDLNEKMSVGGNLTKRRRSKLNRRINRNKTSRKTNLKTLRNKRRSTFRSW